MTITQKNKLSILYKKVQGRSHTNSHFEDINELYHSDFQLDNTIIFGETIPQSPSASLYSISDDIVEKLEFQLEAISSSQYLAVGETSGSITDDGTGAPTEGNFVNGVHAYKLKLPDDYLANSINPKKGFGAFVDGQPLADSNGLLQLVPPKHGPAYVAEVSSSSGIIYLLDEEDYYIDEYSGILYLQDIHRIPTKVTAYLYIGYYQSDFKPGGDTYAIQFKSGSLFSGSDDLTWNFDTKIMQVSGTIYAEAKSFDIRHPTKEGLRLRYGSLEGPENGVYVRGSTTERVITMPDYWTGLVDENTLTVNLTSVGGPQNIWIDDIKDNKIYIGGELEKCYFTVFAERKDVKKIKVEYKEE